MPSVGVPYSNRISPTPIDVRRAVLAVLIRTPGGGPLTIAEIIRRTKTESGLDLHDLPGATPERLVSDILRHQVRYGRAMAPVRGRYQLDLAAFSASTRWRCLHWRYIADRRRTPDRYLARYRGEPWED